jgi:indole-3-acetate monooxygenase
MSARPHFSRTETWLGPAQLRQAARELVPEIATRADEIATLRRLPRDLVAKLRAGGAFRMSSPAARGGLQLHPGEQLEIVEVLSAADPAVGWCAVTGAASGFFSAFVNPEANATLFPDADQIVAGDLCIGGRAQRVPGGYRVSGQWHFGSGCTHADVIVAQCPVHEGEAPASGIRVMMAHAASWQILDTWDAIGLAGSGSADFTAHDLFVPEAHTFSLLDAPYCDEPLYRCGHFLFAALAGVPLGLARRAIDVVRSLAAEKPVSSAAPLRPALVHAESLLGAARAYALETLDAAWTQVEARKPISIEVGVALALCRRHAFRTAREIAQRMFDTAGASAVYSSSPLDRLLRDAVTLERQSMLQDPVARLDDEALALI